MSKKRAILALATEWFPRHGGVSTFNRHICIALAASGHEVFCYVPAFDSHEADDADKNRVKLVRPPEDFGQDHDAMLRRRPAMSELNPDIVLAHDRITGPAAFALIEDHFPGSRFVLFIHTDPAELEWTKTNRPAEGIGARADQRERFQIELALKAHLVVAVGPRLFREAVTNIGCIAGAPQVVQMIPGFDCIKPRNQPPKVRCLVLGRAEDYPSKGLDIAAKALGIVQREQWGQGLKPMLVIRGAQQSTEEGLTHRLISESGNPDLVVRVHPFTEDISQVQHEILRSTILLMPSRAEGFGLVAAEALSAGVPPIVCADSGFAELMQLHRPDEFSYWMAPVRRIEHATDDAEAWAKKVIWNLRNREVASERIGALAASLAKEYTWAKSADALMMHLS